MAIGGEAGALWTRAMAAALLAAIEEREARYPGGSSLTGDATELARWRGGDRLRICCRACVRAHAAVGWPCGDSGGVIRPGTVARQADCSGASHLFLPCAIQSQCRSEHAAAVRGALQLRVTERTLLRQAGQAARRLLL